jgi:UDP-N-acetyl-D-glucosamine dehydrogenase
MSIDVLVGGYTATCADAATQFYSKLCAEVIRAKSTREAEMAKLHGEVKAADLIILLQDHAVYDHGIGKVVGGLNVIRVS